MVGFLFTALRQEWNPSEAENTSLASWDCARAFPRRGIKYLSRALKLDSQSFVSYNEKGEGVIRIKKYNLFGLLFLVNGALLYFANLFFPENFALGNSIFTPLQSIVFSGFVWTIAMWYYGDFLSSLQINPKKTKERGIWYLAGNFATLWAMARFALLTGFGASSFLHIGFLAIIANIAQFALYQKTTK